MQIFDGKAFMFMRGFWKKKDGRMLLIVLIPLLCIGCSGVERHRIYDSVADAGEWINVADCIKTDGKGGYMTAVYGYGKDFPANIRRLDSLSAVWRGLSWPPDDDNDKQCSEISSIQHDLMSYDQYYEELYRLTPEHVVEWFACPQVNVESFQICSGTEYARDRNRVYYGAELVALTVKKRRFGNNRKGLVFCIYCISPIFKPNPRTFKYLGDGYAMDRNHLYLCGIEIEWNDSIIRKYIKKVD